ncbi:MAG: hypothetical protein BWY69_01711 [Planctomycetes bacterium ADurb.Bin401]|nr:MAG: hypothetical protein BWY69_01711 [Planctomycetes bacterium ADurb.Bin401]
MAIKFDSARWNKIKTDSNKWWQRKLGRPLIQARLFGAEPGREKPLINCWDANANWFSDFICSFGESVTEEQIVDRWDYALCCTKFLGDAFPAVWPNFGPGILAAFMGSELHTSPDTVWFDYTQKEKIQDLNLRIDVRNYWLNRVKKIAAAAVDSWKGNVQIALTDLGGIMDVLASFRGTEQLIYDIIDAPEDVRRLTMQIRKLWFDCFNEFESIYKEYNPGYTSWEGIFSESRYSILQSDFSYIINNEIFRNFIKSDLYESASMLSRAFYHLDGPVQLKHLDDILSIDAIKGIQWIPGAGQPDISQWPEVYRKIHKAGKLIQIFDFQYTGTGDILQILKEQIGDISGIVYILNAHVTQQSQIEDLLAQYI